MSQQHARYSPSKLELLELCSRYSGDPMLRAAEDDEDESEAAARGNRLHAALETDDDGGLMDDDEVATVAATRMARDALCEGLLGEEWRERRLVIEWPGGTTHGYPDFLRFSEDRKLGVMVDYKTGREPVTPADRNLQQHAYACGAMQAVPELQELVIVLLCPNMPPAERVSTYNFSRVLDYPQALSRLSRVVELAEDPTTPPTPDLVRACRYCERKTVCKPIGEAAMEVAMKYAGLPMPSEFEPGSMATLRDRAIAQILAPVLEDWAKQVRAQNAEAAFEQDVEIPGHDKRTRAGGVSIKDAIGVARMACERYQVDPEAVNGAMRVSLTALVASLREAGVNNPAAEISKEIKEAAVLSGMAEERRSIRFLQRKRNCSPQELLAQIEGSSLLPPGVTEGSEGEL